MFDADMVVLYQVLYETSQQIVSGKEVRRLEQIPNFVT